MGLVLILSHLAHPGVDARERSSWSETLQAILERASSLEEALEPLKDRLAGIDDPREKGQALFETAQVYELSHRFSSAARWYREALERIPDFAEAALRYGGVLLELGEAESAIQILSRMIASSEDRSLQRAGAILRGRAYFLAGDTETALAHAIALADQKNEPEALFLLFDIARVLEDAELLERSRRDLAEHFGLSPEDRLVDSRGGRRSVVAAPLPSRIFQEGSAGFSMADRRPEPGAPGDAPPGEDRPAGEKPEEGRAASPLMGIQTGSFRDRENASYMLRDITALGFSGTIETAETGSGRFYRVIVTLPEGYLPADAQETVVALKEEGIEGFLVFKP